MRSQGRDHCAYRAPGLGSDPWSHLLRSRSVLMEGHHNCNYVVLLPPALAARCCLAAHTPVKARVPKAGALRFDPYPWKREEELLSCLARLEGWRDLIPRVLYTRGSFAVHTYAEGETLDAICPSGTAVTQAHLQATIALFRKMATTPLHMLPPLPEGWPQQGDSTGFLHMLLRFTDEQVRRRYRDEFEELFTALRIPEDAVLRIGEAAGELTPRPFTLLHGDLHRKNLIVRRSGGLFVIDWELALAGDPLYDLATHLCRMQYPRGQQMADVITMWRDSIRQVAPESAAGIGRDLAHYLRYKRVQSVFTDVIRAAERLIAERTGECLDSIASGVRRVLLEASEDLGLTGVPSVEEISKVYGTWLRHRSGEPALR